MNGADGNNLRHWILRAFIEIDPNGAAALVEQLAPLFTIIKRTLAKDSDGAMILNKSVRFQIEPLKDELDKQKAAFQASHRSMKGAVKKIRDDEDRFKLGAEQLYEDERIRLDRLVKSAEDAQVRFTELITWMCADEVKFRMVEVEKKVKDESGQMKAERVKEPMNSNVWALTWDDFFIPKGTLYKKLEDEKKKKATKDEECFPKLSKTSASGGPANIDLEGLQLLWSMNDVDLPGSYKVCREGVTIEGGTPLANAQVIKVNAIERQGDTMRGLVEDPPGWLVLFNFTTGERTADRRWGNTGTKKPAAKAAAKGKAEAKKKAVGVAGRGRGGKAGQEAQKEPGGEDGQALKEKAPGAGARSRKAPAEKPRGLFGKTMTIDKNRRRSSLGG